MEPFQRVWRLSPAGVPVEPYDLIPEEIASAHDWECCVEADLRRTLRGSELAPISDDHLYVPSLHAASHYFAEAPTEDLQDGAGLEAPMAAAARPELPSYSTEQLTFFDALRELWVAELKRRGIEVPDGRN